MRNSEHISYAQNYFILSVAFSLASFTNLPILPILLVEKVLIKIHWKK